MSSKPENPALRAASIQDLRSKISDAVVEVENRKSAVEKSKSLPIINKELQDRVKELARALFFLQSTIYRNRDPGASAAMLDAEEAILNADMATILERRESEKDPDKGEFNGGVASNEKILELVVAEDPVVTAAPVVKKIEELNHLITSPTTTAEAARRVAGESLVVMANAVQKLGFNEQVQDVAKKTSQLTLKLLGKNPNLSNILDKLKGDKGKYVTSHSLMLAEIASGLACRVGWNSPVTYLKLIMASYLHDLPFRDSRLAEAKDLPKVGDPGFTAAEIEIIRTHPTEAAKYFAQFRELPAEIDTLIIQHHERPDGTGYPNGLTHTQIHPLSCLFIMAHDLLDYQLENPGQATLAKFQEVSAGKYTVGHFKKLFTALQTGTPVQI